MSQVAPGHTPTGSSRWRSRLLMLLFFVAVGGLIWSQLPRGTYPTDLSSIGNGRPALVLAFDMRYGGGMAVMELMNDLRGEYVGRVDFLVARLSLEEGQAFANRYHAHDGTVLLFSGDGALVKKLVYPERVETLRGAIDAAFAF